MFYHTKLLPLTTDLN